MTDTKKDIQGHASSALIPQGSMSSFGASLVKRCERLSTALYLVTNFLSDTEPLKPRLRAISLELVRDASVIRHSTISVEANVLENILANITETLALLELAFIAGLVSEMNFTILKREYTSVRSMTEIKRASRESRTDGVLGDTFFGTPLNEERSPSLTLRARSGIGHTESKIFQRPENTLAPVAIPVKDSEAHQRYPQGQKDMTMSDMKSTPKKTRHTPERNTTDAIYRTSKGQSEKINIQAQYSIQKDARRVRILKLIKDNREVTIKDISNHFPELSEKTIQRELVSLTEEGVLEKFGERRWSRYALA